MNKEKMIKARVPKALYNYFDNIRKQTGISISEQVRDGLKFYLLALRATFNVKEIKKAIKSLEVQKK